MAKRSWEEKRGDGDGKKESRQESMHDETTNDIASHCTATAHGDRQNACRVIPCLAPAIK